MESKKSNLINMNNSDLKKLSKSELIKLLLNRMQENLKWMINQFLNQGGQFQHHANR